MNEAEHEAGGIYLFTDEAAAHAYMNGPIMAQIKAAPILSDMRVKLFTVVEELTAITRGPIKEHTCTI